MNREIQEALKRRCAEPPPQLKYSEDRLAAIRRRGSQRRRRAQAAIGSVATTAIILIAIGVAGAVETGLPESDKGSAVGTEGAVTPEPWSDVVVATDQSKLPLPGSAYLVAEANTADGDWRAASFQPADDSHGCLVEIAAGVIATPSGTCFDAWPVEKAVQWDTWRGGPDSDYILILGATGMDARSVRVTFEGGAVYRTEAMATPTSDDLRFFALMPETPAHVQAVEAFTSNGTAAEPPSGLPWTVACDTANPCPSAPGAD